MANVNANTATPVALVHPILQIWSPLAPYLKPTVSDLGLKLDSDFIQ